MSSSTRLLHQIRFDCIARTWEQAQAESFEAGHYEYPTGTNEDPNTNLPSADTGNSANFNPNNRLTDVGAYELSESPYGTFDQGGNVYEWNEWNVGPLYRGLRGGMWVCCGPVQLRASFQSGWFLANDEHGGIGFRVATTIPEPSTIVLLGLGVWLLGGGKRQRTSSNGSIMGNAERTIV